MPPPRLLPPLLLRPSARRHMSSHYDPPTGWFLGVPPGVPPGEKPFKDGWEGIFYWGFFGGLFAAGVAYVYKPDTSIQTWALEEAKRRLQIEGVIADEDGGRNKGNGST